MPDKKVLIIPLSKIDAGNAVNGFSKFLYNTMFQYIVKKLNLTILPLEI